MVDDYKKLDRKAQYLVVEYKPGHGSPPSYPSNWRQAWDAKVDRIEINYGDKPSIATIWFPKLHWNEKPCISKADMVRIRTDHKNKSNQTVVFTGFVTADPREFSGGSDKSAGYNRNAILCQDYRWLLAATSPIFGQYLRGPDDYKNYGTDSQSPKEDEYTFVGARRCIFNANGRPNRDPVDLSLNNYNVEIPLFIDPRSGEYWTAKQMLRYILSPLWNQAYSYFPWPDPSLMFGLDHSDWDKEIYHIVVDGLNVIEAVELICKHLGWSFRQNDYENGEPWFEFFKIGTATSYYRSATETIVLQKPYAPKAGEDISSAVAIGQKLLWAATIQKDIASIINEPWGLAAPMRFEFTAELVPAWLDTELVPDTEELYFTEAEIQDLSDPDSKDYYKYYHSSGSAFQHNVGRKWALNEAADYSGGNYDRGLPFDFTTVIPDEYIKARVTKYGPIKRAYAPFRRQLLHCLTLDKSQLNSIGIRVEFSFDGGSHWQVIPARISSLPDEAGIYIDEENLAEMVDKENGTISEGSLDGEQLNFWTSLCNDRLEGRSYKDGQWYTRVRVTASVQMDQRFKKPYSERQPASGSPFNQRAVFDFSGKYALAKRTESSHFNSSELIADELNSDEEFHQHLDAIRDANHDMSISGSFVFERLWLGEGEGEPAFMVGDCIEKIAGRNFDLSANLAGNKIYPEIIKIIYMPERQQTKLITRDLRFAEVALI